MTRESDIEYGFTKVGMGLTIELPSASSGWMEITLPVRRVFQMSILAVAVLVSLACPGTSPRLPPASGVCWIGISGNPGQLGAPDIARSPSNRILLVWSEATATGSDVKFASSMDGGHAFGPAVDLSATPNLVSDNPRIYCPGLGSGEIFVAWEEYDGTGGSDILLTVSLDRGASFLSPPLNLSNTSAPSLHPCFSSLWSGVVRLVWIEDTGTTTDVLYRDSPDLGQTFGTAVNVSGLAAPNRAMEAAVDEDSAGVIFVAWTEQRAAGGAVCFATSTDGGSTFSTPQALYSTSLFVPSQVSMIVSPGYYYDMLWVAWNEVDSRIAPTESRIWIHCTADSGVTCGEPARITAGHRVEGLTGLDVSDVWPFYPSVVFDCPQSSSGGEIFIHGIEPCRAPIELSVVYDKGYRVDREALGLGHDFHSPRGKWPYVWVDETGIWIGDID